MFSTKINTLLLIGLTIIVPPAANAVIVDACSSQSPATGSAVTDGNAICIPNGSGSNSIQYYYIQVSTNTNTLYLRTAHGTGNGNLYYNASTWATTTANTQSSTNSGNTESINVNSPAQGYRFMSVTGQQSGMTLLASTTNPDGGSSSGGSSSGGSSSGGSSSGGSSSGGSSGGLSNGQTISGLSASQGNRTDNYYIDVPSGASNLVISISGGTGDADLYVKKGSVPTDSSYDCRPYDSGNNETCGQGGDTLATSQGRFYINLKAYSAFSGVSLTASYTGGGSSSGGSSSGGSSSGGSSSGGSSSGGSSSGGSSSGGSGNPSHLHNGETVSGLAATAGNRTTSYYIDVPSGASNLSIKISGGTGDADLYVNKGSIPTDSSYDCRPYDTGNNETCGQGGDTLATSEGRFWINIKAYSAFTGVSLTASYTGGGSSSGGSSSGGSSSGGSSSGGSSSGGSSSGGSSGGTGNHDGYDYNYVHVLIYRFEFSDTALQWTASQLEADMQKVKTYYDEQSYGRFNVTWDMSQPVVNLNAPLSSYQNDWSKWWNDTREKIQNTGVNPDAPGESTLILVTGPTEMKTNFNSSAAPVSMTLFHHDAGTVAHEMGHALGLLHANALEAGGNIIGTGAASENLEYGNVYSMMGMGAHSLQEYNLMYKSYFGWLLDSEVPLITTSGTYKIYAFDHGTAGGSNAPGYIGLKLNSGNGAHTYWLEYRTTNTGYENTKNGVLFNLQGYINNDNQQTFWKYISLLLDMTPGSKTPGWWGDDQTDSELVIGQTYTDHWGGFSVKVLGKGGTENTANAWIEVQITML